MSLAQKPGPTALPNGLKVSPANTGRATIKALFVGDIHFDPFADPAKTVQLVRTDASEWRAILAASPSPDQEQRFESLERTCGVRGIDTTFPLFDSSLKAMRIHAEGSKFILLGGDLVAHAFPCKFWTSFPDLSDGEYESFVIKTLTFVINELRASFPGTPVYTALGNNDSNCGDYHLDSDTDFLNAVGRVVVDDVPSSERQAALKTFVKGGYYSVTLPKPSRGTRLVVVDDIFMSPRYSSCQGKYQSEPAREQIAWIENELLAAQLNHHKVWLLGHIPPGVDLYSTLTSRRGFCNGEHPVMFLKSNDLIDTLRRFDDDVVQLGVFAHTHMDEFRVLSWSNHSGNHTSHAIAIKLLPSISPIDGNNPAFTVASIDSESAILSDYRVFAAANKTGVDTKWNEEYDYGISFRKDSFSSSALEQLVKEFETDPDLRNDSSRDYVRNFLAGENFLALRYFWRQYVCGLSKYTEESFRACACTINP